jgi:hypothetical protein
MTHYYQWTQNNHKQIVSRSSETNTHDISLLTNKVGLEIEPTKITKLNTHKPAQLAGGHQQKTKKHSGLTQSASLAVNDGGS